MSQGESRAVLEEYWRNLYLRGQMLFDPTGRVSQRMFHLPATPTPFGRSFLIGRDRSVLWPSHGYDPQRALDEINAHLAATFGGTAGGLEVGSSFCHNSASGDRLELRNGDSAWFCDLATGAGDRVGQVISGAATGLEPIAGTVTGMTLESLDCENLTSGQVVRARVSGSDWSCEQVGFEVSPADRIRVSASGTASGSTG